MGERALPSKGVKMTKQRFQIGDYRPIYLWGGPGTIRMNRVKFMDQAVNEAAHHEVHTSAGADKVVNGIYSNWIHLMYDWGFPPEIEQEDWLDFEKAASIYHERGVKVFAYIQTSNCVFTGSFVDKDWYAQDASGRKVYYYTNRYMANLLHPEWQVHITELITGAIAAGAVGIFFDNLWDGAMPISLGGVWLGEAGSFDEISKTAYRSFSGEEIPADVHEDTPQRRRYLTWRMQKVTDVVGSFCDHARQLKTDVIIGANDFDMTMRNAPLVYGISLAQQAQVQDVTMIENFAMPKWQADKQVLVNNAQTIRAAREQVGEEAHLSVLSYDGGIGFDGMYPARRFQQTIAEAAACGVSNTIKGTEYYHQGQHTMLTAEEFTKEQAAIGNYQRWLAGHTHWYPGKRTNGADVVLIYPEESLLFDWYHAAPRYFAAGQTLLKAGIAWRVALDRESVNETGTVLVFDDHGRQMLAGYTAGKVVDVHTLSGWEVLGRTKWLDRSPRTRKALHGLVEPLWRSYFSLRFVRRVIDGLRLFTLFTGTNLFDLPSEALQTTLLAQVPPQKVKVVAQEPVLLEIWETETDTQYHLVNYAPCSQQIEVIFSEAVKGSVTSPDTEVVKEFNGSRLSIALDVYVIVKVKKHG
jgi:hypothetical protein